MGNKNLLRTFLIYWLPPIAWMAFIFPSNQALTVQSTSSFLVPILNWLFPNAGQAAIDIMHVAVRKFFHFFDFAFLAFLLFRAFQADTKEWNIRWVFYSGAIAVGYAGLDEFVQTMLPLREGSVYDWLLDSAGAGFTMSLLYLKSKKSKVIHAETRI
jgi:VanZ family protein